MVRLIFACVFMVLSGSCSESEHQVLQPVRLNSDYLDISDDSVKFQVNRFDFVSPIDTILWVKSLDYSEKNYRVVEFVYYEKGELYKLRYQIDPFSLKVSSNKEGNSLLTVCKPFLLSDSIDEIYAESDLTNLYFRQFSTKLVYVTTPYDSGLCVSSVMQTSEKLNDSVMRKITYNEFYKYQKGLIKKVELSKYYKYGKFYSDTTRYYYRFF